MARIRNARTHGRAGAGSQRRNQRGNQRGVVAVEFALVVPMLLLIVFGVLEFSFMMNRDVVIDNAARDGARVASLNGNYAAILSSIQAELSDSGIPVSGTGAAVIKIDCKKANGAACYATPATYDGLAESGATAMVKVTYVHKWITPLISAVFSSGSTTLEQTTQMRVE